MVASCSQWEKTHGHCSTPDAPPPPLPPPLPHWPPLPPLAPGVSCARILVATHYVFGALVFLMALEHSARARVSKMRPMLRLAITLVPIAFEALLLSLFFYASPLAMNGCSAWASADDFFPFVVLVALSWSVGTVVQERFFQRAFRARVSLIEQDLPQRILDGTVRLLRASWLVSRPGWFVMRRRQELPEEALYEPREAVRLLTLGKLAALSCKWLKPSHADPDAVHLDAVRRFYSSAAHLDEYPALFWDWGSLPQRDASLYDQSHTAEAQPTVTQRRAFNEGVAAKQLFVGGEPYVTSRGRLPINLPSTFPRPPSHQAPITLPSTFPGLPGTRPAEAAPRLPCSTRP